METVVWQHLEGTILAAPSLAGGSSCLWEAIHHLALFKVLVSNSVLGIPGYCGDQNGW